MKPSLTYANPLWEGYLADPFVIRWQGAYYAYGTGPVQPDGRCFPLLRSPDLVTWEHVGGALEPPADLPEDSAYWAPAVAERDGTFYLYYSAAPPGDDTGHRLRVATAGHPAGPFVDTGRVLVPESAGFAIDADPFRDPRDGRWHLFFATDFLDGERPGTGLAVVPLGDDMVTAAGEPAMVLRASADWQIYQRDRPLYGRTWDAWHTVEGPCVLNGPEGQYYCLYSGGNWETPGYGVSYAVADHPLGPWREGGHGPVVLRGAPERGVIGPGHNSVVLAPDGVTPFVVYHAWDAARTARRMCIDPLLWTPDGPRCDGPSTGRRTVPLAGNEGSDEALLARPGTTTMKGSELSQAYFEECLLPLIRRFDPDIEAQMAAGVFGMGSDASGLDDELSREHHWGPRCNLLLSDSLEAHCARLESYLQANGPKEYRGYPVYHLKANRCGVTVETVSQYFRDMVGQAEAPRELADWFSLTEADLFHITGGQVFVDHPGEFSRRVQGFAYYPEPVWRKKLADWCVFLVGHGVYNINRARQRQDWASATLYFGVTVKRLLEMGHLLNRTYAPYNKWLYRSFSRLPLLSARLLPLLDHALETPSWEARCLALIQSTVAINDELERQGLAKRGYPAIGSPEIGEAWFYFLYDAAVELYRSLPEELVYGRFREVEKWEEVVKQVILSPDWKAGFHETTASADRVP